MTERDAETGRFLTGNNGGGRTKGARSKLGEAFLADLHDAWQENGPQIIQASMWIDPVGFLRVIAGVLPKDLNINVTNDSASLSTVELNERIVGALERIEALTKGVNGSGASEVRPSDLRQLN